ncbi:hypothetical protein TK45_00345 [Bowmanella sp. JS7-9]|nr:hypothetical protein TK45_00345 [Bowmanella sp. JS7-9]
MQTGNQIPVFVLLFCVQPGYLIFRHISQRGASRLQISKLLVQVGQLNIYGSLQGWFVQVIQLLLENGFCLGVQPKLHTQAAT